MAKKAKTPTKAIPQPAFSAGCVITMRSIYIDANGHAWVVDPEAGRVYRITI